MFPTEESTSVDRGQFRATVDVEQARRQREQTTVQIRKNKKQERLNQRRRLAPTNADGNLGSLATPPTQNMEEMMKGLDSPDPEVREKYVSMFRKILSIETTPPIDAVVKAGAVPRFVSFLRDYNHPGLQFEAAWALTNVASGTTAHTSIVIQAGALPIFVELLDQGVEDVREQAVWALGNIAGDSASLRDLVLQANAVPALLRQLTKDAKKTLLRNATWTLSNLCRGKPPPEFDQVSSTIPALASLIFMNDTEVLTDACWALSYLSDGPNEKIQHVVNAGVVPRLVELLAFPNVTLQTPALRTVGNIVTGDDLQTQTVLNAGALPNLKNMLDSKKKGIKKEACWTISNITAGNAQQVQAVMDAGIFEPLIRMMATEQFEIQKEAIWALSNATASGTSTQVSNLVQMGCIKPLCDALTVTDAKVILVALEGIENVLRTGELLKGDESGENPYATLVEAADGVAKIENLQTHKEKLIYAKTAAILDTYFDLEENTMIDGADQQQDTFSFGTQGQQQAGGFSFN